MYMTKNDLLNFIDRELPENSVIELTQELARPIDIDYLKGYGGNPTDIVGTSTEKGSLNINYKYSY